MGVSMPYSRPLSGAWENKVNSMGKKSFRERQLLFYEKQ